MPNRFGVPEITAQEVEQLRRDDVDFVVVDVRELWEIEKVHLNFPVCVLPLSRLAQTRLAGIPEQLASKERKVVVMCHHGIRSAEVAAWLCENGWTDVRNLEGGIAEYAASVDPSIGTY